MNPKSHLSWSPSDPRVADLPSEKALGEGGEFALAVLNEVALFAQEVIKLLALLRDHHPGVLLHAQSQR